MKNNTIEVKLNSYGTLEVVSIPVKLYKDSYNVVKLKVVVPKSDNSTLKVYGSGRDEAGELVWTTATYSLPYKQNKVIDRNDFDVYEDYLPQEFCLEEGDITLNFALVKYNEEVEEVVTSGSLNLYVSGDGFNSNGVKISDYDSLSVKVNKILQDKDYDLKIYTQTDFDNFIDSIINKTCTATSVLFVGDGGDLIFTRVLDSKILLPNTLKVLDGINNAKIKFIKETGSSTTTALQYETLLTKDDSGYCVNNIHFICEFNDRVICLMGFINISNCICEISSNISTKNSDVEIYAGAFDSCINLINCNVISHNKYLWGYCECQDISNCDDTNSGFIKCNNISNCIGAVFKECDYLNNVKSKGVNRGSYGYPAFGGCNYLNNCYSEAETNGVSGFTGCNYLTNCYASIKVGAWSFAGCNYLTNCVCNKLYFYKCNYLTNCIVEEKENKLDMYNGCTNISATIEEVNNTIGDLNTLLTNLNSGEGV